LLADIVILLIVASNILTRFAQTDASISHWGFLPDQNGNTISWAGIWILSFSLTIFQYLIFRWIWRWVIWVIYFKKIAAMPLKLNAAHPDLAGGLGFLGMPPGPFLPVTFCIINPVLNHHFRTYRFPSPYIERLLSGYGRLCPCDYYHQCVAAGCIYETDDYTAQ
jgi:hypothetical protein